MYSAWQPVIHVQVSIIQSANCICGCQVMTYKCEKIRHIHQANLEYITIHDCCIQIYHICSRSYLYPHTPKRSIPIREPLRGQAAHMTTLTTFTSTWNWMWNIIDHIVFPTIDNRLEQPICMMSTTGTIWFLKSGCQNVVPLMPTSSTLPRLSTVDVAGISWTI